MTERPSPDQTHPVTRAKLLDLSLPQLIGGSLAAATAAALGSRLGVVGTITGAAIGSVVTAVAANLYTNSVSRAHEAIVTTLRPAPGVQRVAAIAPLRREERPVTPQGYPRASSDRHTWTAPLVSAAAVFAVAVAFLAGFQLATGSPVTGTTVGTGPEAAYPGGGLNTVERSADGQIDPGAAVDSEPVPAATTTPTVPPTREAPTPTSSEPTAQVEPPATTPAPTSPAPQTPTAPAMSAPTG